MGIVIFISILLGIVRPFIKGHDVVLDFPNLFKTFAHFFLGGLVATAILERAWWPMIPFTLLTCVELLAFFRSGAKITLTREEISTGK